jgi:hypothetical protein
MESLTKVIQRARLTAGKGSAIGPSEDRSKDTNALANSLDRPSEDYKNRGLSQGARNYANSVRRRMPTKAEVHSYACSKLEGYQNGEGILGLTTLGFAWWSTVEVCTRRSQGYLPSMR